MAEHIWTSERIAELTRLVVGESLPPAEISRLWGGRPDRKTIQRKITKLDLVRPFSTCLNCGGRFAHKKQSKAFACGPECSVVLAQKKWQRYNTLNREQINARRRAARAAARELSPNSREIEIPHAPCIGLGCGAPIVRRSGERSNRFRTRTRCDACAAVARVAPTPASVPRAAQHKTLPPISDDDATAAIARFIADRGVTRVPPAFVAPSQHASVFGAEAKRRIAAIELADPLEWKKAMWGGAI